MLLAAICKQYGKFVGGGYEIFIPNTVIGALPRSKDATIQQTPDPQGVRLKYHPNITIDGVVVKPPEPELSSPMLPEPQPPHTEEGLAQ